MSSTSNKNEDKKEKNHENNIISTTTFPQPTNQHVLDLSYNKHDNRNVQSEVISSTTIDTESEKGWFGWDFIGQKFIPYILRAQEKYCALRMVDILVLDKYLSKEIYNKCTYIRSYYITEKESRLLNEINYDHCDNQFGYKLFTREDLIIKFNDAKELYKFQRVCYYMLKEGNTKLEDRIGFVRMNNNSNSIVPYITKNFIKFIPLLYFETLSDKLSSLKTEIVKDWDLSYLKFCFTIQGIRQDLFTYETCTVLSLDEIKHYFPPNTRFENYWPSRVPQSLYLLQHSWNGDLVTYPTLNQIH